MVYHFLKKKQQESGEGMFSTKQLSKQYAFKILLVLILFFTVFLVISKTVLPKFYEKSKENILTEATETIKKKPEITAKELKETYGVAHVTQSPTNLDEYELSENLMKSLQSEGLAVNRVFYDLESLEKMRKGKVIFNIVEQPAGKADFYSQAFYQNNELHIVGFYVSQFKEVSQFFIQFYLLFFAIILSLLFIVLLGLFNKISDSLKIIQGKTKQIAKQEYVHVNHYPDNELGELAYNVDEMSDQLQKNDDKLRRHNEEIQQLSSDLSHELKTPLAVIQANAYAIRDDIGERDDNVDTIVLETEEMTQLINSLLSLVNLKKNSLMVETIDLSEKLKNTLDDFKKKYTVRERKIYSEIEPNVTVTMESRDLEILVNNLISNAYNYSEKTISVVLTKSVLIIKNDYQKTYQGNINNLWDAFVIGDESRHGNSTGIGLASVDAIVKKYDFRGNLKEESGLFEVKIDLKR